MSSRAEDGAAQFFFNNYVIDHSVVSSTFFSRLPDLCAKAPADGALMTTISAIGLASFSNTKRAWDIRHQAALKYATAVRSVNAMIKDPAAAQSDELLIVVVLLAFYEENGTNPQTMQNLTHHVLGALAILDARGLRQFQTSLGMQLMRAVRVQIIANCLARRVSIPPRLLKWSRLARRYEAGDEKSEGEFSDILADFCNLNAKISGNEGTATVEAILAQAMMIDGDLANWAERDPAKGSWRPISVSGQAPDVFADYWDLYANVGAAFIWNHYRTVRILVNEIIIEQLNRLVTRVSNVNFQSPLHDQISDSKQIMATLAREICASIPFYLGRRPVNNDSNYDTIFQPQNAVHGRVLLWPLYAAGKTVDNSDPMRLWIVARLKKIALVMENHKASSLARVLSAPQSGEWLGYKDLPGWQNLLTKK